MGLKNNLSLLTILILLIGSCDFAGEISWDLDIYSYQGVYNMIEVPVPPGGITFPVGFYDNDIATLSSAFYLGETQVTFGLYQTVCIWATYEKNGPKYTNLYYPDYRYPKYTDKNISIHDYPVCAVTYFEILVWCNAYTEWHNEKYGTDYTPVYTDNSGIPIRETKASYSPNYINKDLYDRDGNLIALATVTKAFYDYYIYLSEYPKMEDYLSDVETTGNGFRLPTPNEWELAARWRGNDNTNSVTGIVKGIDISSLPIKFTRGNSVSGAMDYIGNLNQNHQYAVFEYNSKSMLSVPGTKAPNALGFYDMSGNLREFVYHVTYIDTPSQYDAWGALVKKDPYPFAFTKGGYFEDKYEWIAIGSGIYVDATSYNYFYGFRVARNK